MDGKTSQPKESTTFQPLSVWIMKKATSKPIPEKELPTDPGTYETPIVFNPDAAKKKKLMEEKKEEEAEDETVPVRQMVDKSAKKRKHSSNPSGETPRPKKDRRGEHAERSVGNHRHGNQDGNETEERVIEPFDYSKVDYNMFQESQHSRGRGRGHRGRDRGQRGHRGHSKGHPRPKVHQDGGRSMTYTKHHGNRGGGNRGQRGHWPRNQRR
nr:zinc finger CCCH domain-containing protein 4-like [Lytechinus pictus]